MPSWAVVWTARARRDLRRLPQDVQRRAATAVDRHARTEQGDVRRLQGVDPPLWRLRVGEYRVLLSFDYDSHRLEVRNVLPRGSAYREL